MKKFCFDGMIYESICKYSKYSMDYTYISRLWINAKYVMIIEHLNNREFLCSNNRGSIIFLL